MRRPKVDLNQALESKSSTPSPQQQQQVHNFMPITPFLLPYHQDEEEAINSCLMQKQKQNIDMFWNRQLFEIYNTTVFKSNHQLPLARIKRIIKSNGDVKMISADTPIVFAKACELFILELTLRAWLQTEECRRRTLQRCDIARALRLDEILDFLVDFVPCNSHKDDDSDNSSEEINELHPLHPANQVYSPGVDINGKFNPNHDVPQQIVMKPSLTLAEFNHGSTSPRWKAKAEAKVTEMYEKLA